jgi:hypothetical protein
MRTFKASLLLFIIAVCASLSGCTDSRINEMTHKDISLGLHESGEVFHKRYPGLVQITHQPAGAFFYKAQWQRAEKGSVTIKAGDSIVKFVDVLSLLAIQDEKNAADGVFTIDLTSGITGSDGITHGAARDYIFSVLSQFRSQGWRYAIPFSEPRLRGAHMLNYKLATGGVVLLDADHKPTLDEWIKLPDRSGWRLYSRLYSNGAFLTIKFNRAPDPKNPTGPGVYLISYNVTSDVNYFKGLIEPLKREDWKTLLPAELKDLATRRRTSEAVLSEKGIPIDTDYVDPPVPR